MSGQRPPAGCETAKENGPRQYCISVIHGSATGEVRLNGAHASHASSSSHGLEGFHKTERPQVGD